MLGVGGGGGNLQGGVAIFLVASCYRNLWLVCRLYLRVHVSTTRQCGILCSCVAGFVNVIILITVNWQFKSMAQHLENTDKFFWTRKSRFPDQFLGDIRAMVNSTVYEITTKLEVSIL